MIAFIKGLGLSLKQWFYLIGALGMGMLIFLFRLRGSELHRLQVQVLHERFKNEDEKADTNVQKARDAFEKALHDYANNKPDHT